MGITTADTSTVINTNTASKNSTASNTATTTLSVTFLALALRYIQQIHEHEQLR